MFSNGGWDYITPAIGWQGYDVGAREILRFDGVTWQRPHISVTPLGGCVDVRSTPLDLVIAPGASATTDPIFPERSIGLGVTGLVTSTLTGTLSTWAIGVAEDPLRFGSGISLSFHSWVNGPQAPLVYWSPTALTLTEEGGVFSGGTVRLVAHYIELRLHHWV